MDFAGRLRQTALVNSGCHRRRRGESPATSIADAFGGAARGSSWTDGEEEADLIDEGCSVADICGMNEKHIPYGSCFGS